MDESTRSRYDRLLKHKGSNVVVGIQHGVCGGCHMQLSRSTIVTCQAEQGDRHLHELRTHSLLHPRHGSRRR